MKSLNTFSKVFILSIIWTVVFLSLAGFATNKALAQDPGLLQKVQDKYKWRLHISGMSKGNRNFKETKDSWSFPANAKKIVITSLNGEIAIKQGTGSTLRLVATGELDSSLAPRLLEAEMSHDELIIKDPSEEEATKDLKVYLEIPSEFQKDIEIKTVSGNVSLENLKFDNLDLKSVSGEFFLKQVTINDLDLKTVSGNISASESGFMNINGKSVSGDLSFESRSALSADILTVSGDIKMKLPNSDDTQFSVSSLSGNTKNSHSGAKKSVREVILKSTSGDIEIE